MGDEERERLAGHARLFVVNADAAARDGQSLFNLLDIRPELDLQRQRRDALTGPSADRSPGRY